MRCEVACGKQLGDMAHRVAHQFVVTPVRMQGDPDIERQCHSWRRQPLQPGVSAASIITFGFLLQCAGFFALSQLTTATAAWWLNGALMLVGIGSAISVPSITNAMLASVSKQDAGMASGLMASARQMGGVIGVAVCGALISAGDTAAFMRGMSHAMLFSLCSLLACLIVVLKMQPAKKSLENI